MKKQRKRKCCYCSQLYRPDSRNVWHQKYCSKPECRKASKAASQRCWLNKKENSGYFLGTENVQRVQEWRKAHPRYWQRKAPKRTTALQEGLSTQGVGGQRDKGSLNPVALQDVLFAEPAMVVGLISNLTGSTLQDDIARTSRKLLLLGQNILGNLPGKKPKGVSRDGKKTCSLPRTSASCSATVQLGRSSPGTR